MTALSWWTLYTLTSGVEIWRPRGSRSRTGNSGGGPSRNVGCPRGDFLPTHPVAVGMERQPQEVKVHVRVRSPAPVLLEEDE